MKRAVILPVVLNRRKREWYVDATAGSDANVGSLANPYATVAAALAVAVPNATLNLKGGETWRNDPLTVPCSGLTVKAYGTGKPTLTGAKIAPSGSWAVHSGSIYKQTITGLSLGDTTGCWVDGVRLARVANLAAVVAAGQFTIASSVLYVWCVANANPSGKVVEYGPRGIHGLDTNGKTDLVFSNLILNKWQYNGIAVDVAGSKNVQLRACEAHWNQMRGLTYSWGAEAGNTYNDLEATLCSAHDNLGEGFWGGYGYRQRFGGCTAYDNGIDTTPCGYGAVVFNAGSAFTFSLGAIDCIIEDCVGYNTKTGAKGTGLLSIEDLVADRPDRCIVRRNHLYSDLSATFANVLNEMGHDTLIYNNLIENITGGNAHNCIGLNGGADGTMIYFNTIRKDYSNPAVYFTACTGPVFKNNIVMTAAASGSNVSIAADCTSPVLDYNEYGARAAWYQGASFISSLVAWKAAFGEANSLQSDPLFVTNNVDYHLQAGSPCKNTGVAMAGISTDYEQTARGATPSRGAYE